MKKILLLAAFFSALPAHAGQIFLRPHDADSVVIGPVCVMKRDGTEIFALDFNTTNLVITITATGTSSVAEFNYTGANIDDGPTSPASDWGNPTTDAVEVSALATGANTGCVLLHLRDEVLAHAGAQEWGIQMNDGATDAIMDYDGQIIAVQDSAAIVTDVETALTNKNLDTLATAFVKQTGTCDSGSTTTCVDAALTEADDDYWQKGIAIIFTNSTLAGQSACVYDFAQATDTLTFRPAVTQAVSTHTYILVSSPICGGVAAP